MQLLSPVRHNVCTNPRAKTVWAAAARDSVETDMTPNASLWLTLRCLLTYGCTWLSPSSKASLSLVVSTGQTSCYSCQACPHCHPCQDKAAKYDKRSGDTLDRPLRFGNCTLLLGGHFKAMAAGAALHAAKCSLHSSCWVAGIAMPC